MRIDGSTLFRFRRWLVAECGFQTTSSSTYTCGLRKIERHLQGISPGVKDLNACWKKDKFYTLFYSVEDIRLEILYGIAENRGAFWKNIGSAEKIMSNWKTYLRKYGQFLEIEESKAREKTKRARRV